MIYGIPVFMRRLRRSFRNGGGGGSHPTSIPL